MTPEAQTREKVDPQRVPAGWAVQDLKSLNWSTSIFAVRTVDMDLINKHTY